MIEKQDDLERTKELHLFLQGIMPEGYKVPLKSRPNLTPEQAWTVIWYLGNLYWQVTDHIEKCDVCEDIFDSLSGGSTLDFGKAPYHFCDSCMNGAEYFKKAISRSNPDKEQRQQLREEAGG